LILCRRFTMLSWAAAITATYVVRLFMYSDTLLIGDRCDAH